MALIEIAGSNTSQHAIGSGNSSTRVFLCPWGERFMHAENLLGSAHPNIPFCWCNKVDIKPCPDEAKSYPGPAIAYDTAQLTAEYGTDFTVAQMWPASIPRPAIRNNTSLQLSMSSASEFMRFPARMTRWEDNTDADPAKPIPEEESSAGRLLVSQADFTLTWNYVDNPPLYNYYEGAVNAGGFLGKPPETLLFEGYELREGTKAQITNPTCWIVTVKLKYRAIITQSGIYGWNHEYRREGWKRVLMWDGNSWTNRYRVVPFTGMFV